MADNYPESTTPQPTDNIELLLARIAKGVAASGGGGGGGGAATIADGADVAQGSKGDAAVVNPASSASLVALEKGSLTQLLALLSTAGATSGAAVITDANGTLQQYLRGLVVLQAGGLKAGEAHLGEVGGRTALASAVFTRPGDTNSYAVADLVANSTTAGSVVPMTFTVARVAAGSGMIRRCRLKTSSTSLVSASFRLHLYKTSPTVSNGDNAAWLTNQSANYLGSFDVTLDKTFTDGASGHGVPGAGSEINFLLASGTDIFGVLEARAAYTPTNAGTFTVELEVLQN